LALRADFTSLPVLVRVNGSGTAWHSDDLAAASQLPLAAIIVPKAELDGDLELVGSGSVAFAPILALIETTRGLSQARQIAVLECVERLAFGSVDFCADLGCAHTRDALLAARSELVLASKLAGKFQPIDGVTTVIEDRALIRDDARHARDLGFGGKLCIHPRQVEAARAGFHPDATEIAWARKIVASGDGATAVNGAMVDEAVRIRARSILAKWGCD
jgi:citrate lyase subunit beta/citryl-CoA lyase